MGTFSGTFPALRRSQAMTGEPGHPVQETLSRQVSARRPRYVGLKDGVGMSRSQLVAEHLPLLRRYARALTGNQASGDAYVGAMLEALLQDASLLDEQHGARAGPVPAVHPDLEFGLAQRQPRSGDAAAAVGTPALEYHAAAAAGLPAAVAGRFFRGGSGVHSRLPTSPRPASSPTPPAAKWPPKSPPTC